MTVVLIALVGIVGGRHPSAKISEFAYWFQRDRLTYTTLLGLFILNVAFFSIKPIAMDYYLIPLLTLCSLLALVAISEVAGQNIDVPLVGYKKSLLLCVVFAGLIFGVNKIVNTPAANTELFIPKDMLREDSIVYADTSSGTLYRYKNKYASKIAFGSQCMQEQFVHHVARSGRDQYFVMDSSKMQVLVDRLGVRQFDFVGAVSSEHINFPVLHYKPNTSDDFPKITCDFNSPPALVSQLELKINARVQANRYVGTAELVNQSDQAFSTRPNAFPIRLAWRILPTVQNALVEIWPNRIDLDLMIRPHSTSQIPIDIPLPPHSGALKLEFTLVQEGLAWFHERGMKPAVIQINAESLR
jgi:hypothetical protein